MFLGVSTHNLDAKGRLAVPARYREELDACCESKVVLTIHPKDKCLWLYPEDEWEHVEAKVSKLPPLKRENQVLQRLLLGHASPQELDGQGRMLIPAELREYAGLGKKVALMGQGRKIEIWDDVRLKSMRDDWIAEAGEEGTELSGSLEELEL